MSDEQRLMALGWVLYFVGYTVGALGLGTLSAALIKLWWGRLYHIRIAILTALLLSLQLCSELPSWLLTSKINPQYKVAMLFWMISIGKIVAGTCFGTLFGHVTIARLMRRPPE
jgi:hypothetical protein